MNEDRTKGPRCAKIAAKNSDKIKSASSLSCESIMPSRTCRSSTHASISALHGNTSGALRACFAVPRACSFCSASRSSVGNDANEILASAAIRHTGARLSIRRRDRENQGDKRHRPMTRRAMTAFACVLLYICTWLRTSPMLPLRTFCMQDTTLVKKTRDVRRL